MLTDLVGSTALWEQEPTAMAAALERHDSLVEEVVVAAGGDLIRSKGEGDSTFSVFSDALAAVVAACDLAAELGRTEWPTRAALKVRVGVHVGAAEHRGDSWFGSAVNRTARLRALAPPGVVLVSDATAGLVRHELPARLGLSYVGQRCLRGFREPERIWAATPEGLVAPPLPDSADTNVSIPHRQLTGRDPDVDRIQRLLSDRRLVTLVGVGGSGKTRLAVEVALRGRDSFPDGVWLVDLTSVNDPDAVVSTVLSVLGAASVGALADRELLIVLDSCEHVVSGAAAAAAVLLTASSGTRILATSRQPLGHTSEVVAVVGPLAVPTRVQGLDDLVTSPSFALFRDCAQSIDNSFTVDPAEVPDLARLLVALEGLPLAIEIAAAQTRTMSLARLAVSVEEDLPSLPLPWRDAADRHRSVARTIEWSVGLLGERRQGGVRGGVGMSRIRCGDCRSGDR